ncbi:MAG: ATP-dependent zinc metalloprotease FtsH [Planctomycetota bacterium]|nr:ATP-dependent zinc metalloprotease FtsH [Planctomycetota bacterium]
MNEEPKANPNNKEKKPRSLGSFLLFLFLLIAILVLVGRQSMVKPEVLTQDQYLAYLHMGRIEVQVFQGNTGGSNLIEGTFVKHPGEKAVPFRVNFGDVEANEAAWQELKATHIERTLPAESFLEAVAGGWYEPVRARSLRLRYIDTPEAAPGADPQVSPATKERLDEKLYVEVIASSAARWERQDGIDPTEAPPFYLPRDSSHVWFEIDMTAVPGRETPELGAVLGRLAALDVPISTHAFELGERRGSSWREDGSTMMSVLMTFGPFILLALLFFFFMRQARGQGSGGMMSFGKSRAQLYTKENHTGITFQDVAGAAEAKAEVREIVEFLRNPSRFTRIGGRIPRGILLVGPPGCGKTLLAKAIAGEAEVPFFAISGSDFVEMFVGVGASRVRDLFKQARDNSPCIIFLDEIDAVGRRRGGGMGGGHDEREQTLNAILVEMDGFGTDDGIILLAATNRPDVLDPALLRPGRFDREVTIDMPDQKDREKILGVHLAKVRSVEDLDVALLARSTPGYSGADLAAIVNEAAIMAVLDGRDRIDQHDLEESRDKVRYGRKKINRNMEEEDRKVTAYHEAGHAVVAAVLPDANPPTKVTIIPRGRSLGATMMTPEKETLHQQRRRLIADLATFFGGRAAEARFCGDISAGAYDDIRRATQIARSMVTELGMSEAVGPINYGERQGSEFLGTELMRDRSHSEEIANLIDKEVKRLIDEAYETAETVLAEHNNAVEEIARALLMYETVDGSGVQRLVDGERAEDIAPVERKDVQPGPTKAPERPEEKGDDLPDTAGFSPA